MSLAAIAVVSRRSGKPLYMRSFVESSDLLFGQYGQNETVGADFFGDILVEESLAQKSEWSCEEKYEFMLHAASDRLDEMKWKKPGAAGADACWVGLLCSMDSFNAYGYVTTNANYVVIVEDGIAPDNVQLQKSRDVELKTLIQIMPCLLTKSAVTSPLQSYVHRAYTESLLNPFSDINAKITSERFTKSVKSLVAGFNQI
eukprot:scaffold14363_cov98-Skeletonema_dohrnii-CCMP3373.AAC.3